MWQVVWAALISFGAAFLPRLLAGLGVFAVTDSVSGQLISALQDKVFAQLNAAGTVNGVNVVAILQYVGLFDFVKILFSAYTAAFAIKLLKQQAAVAANAAAGAASQSANSKAPGGS